MIVNSFQLWGYYAGPMELTPLPQSSSPLDNLNKTDWIKTARGAAIFGLGWLLVTIGNGLTQELANVDFSSIIPVDLPGIDEQQLVIGVLSTLIASMIELGRRWKTNYQG